MHGRIASLVCLLAAVSLAVAGPALGKYPEKAVQLIVPYPPGGISDLTARVLSQNIEPFLGQQLLVVNKPGGGGAIGGFAVTRGEPGYTMGIFAPVLAFPEFYRQEAAYTSADHRPVARQFMMLTTIVVKADAPPNNLKEFIQWVEKNPGMKYGHTGKGATTHLVGVDLADLLGLKMVDLPFQGDAQVVTAVLGGHAPIGFANLPGVVSHIKAGTLKGIAIYADKRMEEVPQVPTVAEQGVTLRLPYPFGGLFAPKGTTDAQLNALSEAVGKASAQESYKAEMKKIGAYSAYLARQPFEKELATYKVVAEGFAKKLGMIK
ncbi:MAG TPA: tripartite tricarboxylate transporter substrate binding protein [Thermodesulfobacteriota bacterium]|nr:tripartite tricarboxylate transporter substrate binding protein [Thermodesulfobacteriota bacterium]